MEQVQEVLEVSERRACRVIGQPRATQRYQHRSADDEEKLSTQNLWSIGPKAGLTIAPYSKVSLFIETRFLFTPQKVKRKVYKSRGILGGLEEKETEYYFNAFSIGAGIKFYFN